MTIIRHRSRGRNSPRPTSLEARLEALEAAEAARGLLARYADAVDSQDPNLLTSLLHRDVQLSIGDTTVSGRPAVTDFFKSAFADDPARKSHFVTNVRTTWLGEGRVAIDSYFLWTAGGPEQSIIGWGTYSNEVLVAEGPSSFLRIEIDIRHVGELADGWTVG